MGDRSRAQSCVGEQPLVAKSVDELILSRSSARKKLIKAEDPKLDELP